MHDNECKNNYFLNWISALVKEMGGKIFQNCNMTLPTNFGLETS